MNQALLSTQSLTVAIAGRVLCRQLNAAFFAGQCWAILGLNGVGKTSLLHCLAGIRQPQSGSITLQGQALQQWSRGEISRRLAVLLQDGANGSYGRVIDYVLLGRHPHLPGWRPESEHDWGTAEAALATVDLASALERDITSLSGGEKQRLAIAMVLAQQPQIYLLDEPVNHLDVGHQHRLLQHWRHLCREQQALVVMAVHDANLAQRYADHVVLMYQDGKVDVGATPTLLTAERLSKLYDYPVCVVETREGVFIMPSG